MSTLNRQTLTGTTLVIAAIVFIAVLALISVLLRGARIDLTSSQLYTLSEGTEAILDKIEEPVNLYLYFSDGAAQDYPMLRTYANRVRELLEEMEAKSDGMLRLEVIDPLPFSEDEDRATGFGLQAVPLGGGAESLFFGLAGTNATDGQALIPFFQPDKEAFLEYDIAKLVSSLAEPVRPVVGVLSSIDMAPGFDPASQRMNEGWVFDSELRALFDLREIEPGAVSLPADMELLMLVHPQALSDDLQYAIDQFVLGGGRLLAFVDPHAESQSAAAQGDPASMFAEKSSNLPRLFEAWGIQFDTDRVVLDAERALQIQAAPNQPPVRHLAILGLGDNELNQDDVISGQLGTVNFSTAGHLMLADGSALTLEPLAQSSASAGTVASDRVRMLPDPESLFSDFTPTGERYVLAARLTGELQTAFPDREGEGHLAESSEPVNMVIVADSDLLSDRLWVQVQQFLGQRILNAFANNGDFAVNAVDNLVGNSDLIKVRARGSAARPFTTVEALKRAADDRFRAKEEELQAELAATEQKLSELQGARDDAGGIILTPEQSAELERFQDEKLRIRKELRAVRRQLDADIESLGTRLKILNIAGVPLLLTVIALGFAFSRARRRKEAK